MSSLEQTQLYRDVNRARWDELVPIHAASDFYGVDRFLVGETQLHSLDFEEVGDVQDKTLLHLQCHFGLDTLSWAREGANVVGLDFSGAAVAEAQRLAERAGLSARFVESDVYDAPSALSDLIGQVEIVYVNLGALCWLPDISRWAQICASFLQPNGILYVRDVHPITWCLDDERDDRLAVLRYPYFEQIEPLHWHDDGDYADPDAVIEGSEGYEWNHSLGEIVTAVVDQGLHIELLHEQDWTVYRAFRWLEETERGIWRLPPDAPRFPLMFSLRATKPAIPPHPSALPSR